MVKIKEKVDKSCIGRMRIKLTWQDHVQYVIYKSNNYDITIAFSSRRKLRQTYRFNYECKLVKNLPTY